MNLHVNHVKQENIIELKSMDISKFNQELAYKVAKANGLEKHQRVKEAIKVWIEISEMVLTISKLPKLDFSFRSMLIEKAEQIINHIKDLKKISSISLKMQTQESVVSPESKRIGDKTETLSKETEFKSKSFPSIQEQRHPEIPEAEKKPSKIIESDDIKNLPKGFKEIETSDDFTIVTPHDKEYVEKILNQDIDMNVFKHPESNAGSDNKEITSKDGNKLICFACGTELPPGTKKCPNCGIKLN